MMLATGRMCYPDDSFWKKDSNCINFENSKRKYLLLGKRASIKWLGKRLLLRLLFLVESAALQWNTSKWIDIM